MEHRREPRFRPNQNATVVVMGFRPGPAIDACVLDSSGSGMRLRTKLPVACGAKVEITARNTVARGSVCRCEPDDDAYQLGVQQLETVSRPMRP